MTGEWCKLFDASTPHAHLAAIVEAFTEQALADFARQLADDPDFSVHERAALVRCARPKLARHFQATIESAWRSLQPRH